jgi:alpha-1,3-rhamnosyl/mannosyltransferase
MLSRLVSIDPDLLFAPAYTMPLLWNGPTALTIHDISFAAHPEWFGVMHGARMRWFTKRSAKKATVVLTVSDFIREQLITQYRLPPNKVHRVYHGIDDHLLTVDATSGKALRDRFNISGRISLMVGSLFERRFPLKVMGAFELLKNHDVTLVIVGDDRRRASGDIQKEIRERGLENKVKWLQYCSEADLAGLYREADHVIYLSAYEGFGLPPLEGMLFGKPAIVSDRGALAEVYGSSALAIADEHESTISTAIGDMISDEKLRGNCIAAGQALVKRLTLERCAEETLEILHAVGKS